MDGLAIILFIISLVLLMGALYFIYTQQSVLEQTSSLQDTSSGYPLPKGSMIGAQCPVGCTCFPNTSATTPSDAPTQMCAFLSDDVMFSCPPECCQPSCVS